MNTSVDVGTAINTIYNNVGQLVSDDNVALLSEDKTLATFVDKTPTLPAEKIKTDPDTGDVYSAEVITKFSFSQEIIYYKQTEAGREPVDSVALIA